MEDVPEIRAHPLIAKLVKAKEDDEGIVELRGFIGSAKEDDDAVPLYTSLDLTECLLVPRDAIVHVMEPKPEQASDEPTRIYVRGSTELRLVSRQVKTVSAQTAARLGPPPYGGIRGWWCEHLLKYCLEEAGPDFHAQIDCLYYYQMCKKRERLQKARSQL